MKTKLALTTISIALILSLAANAYLYHLNQQDSTTANQLKDTITELQNQIVSLNDQTNNLQNRKSDLETRLFNLQAEAKDLQNSSLILQSENTDLQNENALIQSQIDEGGRPKIITRLGATDIRESPAPGHPWSGQIRLYISGEVWNLGSGIARNLRLHVTLYQTGTVANQTNIELGNIEAGSWADVAANINYSGAALTNWTIIPEYDR